VEIDFDSLINLQEIDTELHHISLFLKNFPLQIKEIDNKIEESYQIVIRAKEKLAENQKKRRDLEAKVQDLKTQISKYKVQLNKVKTNREYSSLLKEIEDAQQKVDFLEEEIISEMLMADDIEVEIKEADQKANKIKQELTKKKEGLAQKKREMEEKKAQLLQEKEALLPKIPTGQINLYSKIYKKNSCIALSPVNDEFCSMCHMRIRPQMLNELKAQNKIIICENCGRILYWVKKSA